MGLARRRGDAEEVNLGIACALRGFSVTCCGFLQTKAIFGNRDICAENDASSQPAARKLAYPCPPESRSAQEDVILSKPSFLGAFPPSREILTDCGSQLVVP